VEYLDSSEVFYTLYWGMVSYRGLYFFVSRFGFAVEPLSLVRTRSIRVSAVFYRSTLTLPFFRKRRRGGERRTTLVWASFDGPW
jgi:hypothetical protein